MPCFTKSSETKQACFPERCCSTSANLCMNICASASRMIPEEKRESIPTKCPNPTLILIHLIVNALLGRAIKHHWGRQTLLVGICPSVRSHSLSSVLSVIPGCDTQVSAKAAWNTKCLNSAHHLLMTRHDVLLFHSDNKNIKILKQSKINWCWHVVIDVPQQ